MNGALLSFAGQCQILIKVPSYHYILYIKVTIYIIYIVKTTILKCQGVKLINLFGVTAEQIKLSHLMQLTKANSQCRRF